jgi:hypothetical protein
LLDASSPGGKTAAYKLTLASRTKRVRLVEKIFVDLLDMKGLLDSASDTMTDHQHRQLHTVEQHDSLAQEFGCFPCRRGKVDVVTKRPLVAL